MTSLCSFFYCTCALLLVAACSGSERTGSEGTQASSVIEGQLAVSTRDAYGAVRGELYARV
jgi:hypothetical protein